MPPDLASRNSKPHVRRLDGTLPAQKFHANWTCYPSLP